MEFRLHEHNGRKIVEIISDGIVLANADDAVDLLGNLYFQGFDRAFVHHKNITEEFFTLRSGIAGEVLQKFSNYRIALAIVGDFANVSSKSLQDFIRESNKKGHIRFVPTSEAALEKLSV